MIAVGVDTHKHGTWRWRWTSWGSCWARSRSRRAPRATGSWSVAGRAGGEAVVGIEGTGSYGAGLCQYLQAVGISVVEVERPRRRDRRHGKSDRVDALLAAKRVLAGDGVSTPRAGGNRSALSVLLVAYRSCVEERKEAAQPAAGPARDCAGVAARADRPRQRCPAGRPAGADARSARHEPSGARRC